MKFIFVSTAFVFSLCALPQGMLIKDGDVHSDTFVDELRVTASDRSILEWESFSIGENERVHFSLPDERSLVLNRVIGLEASQVLGRLESNGQCILINPNGVFFGKNSRVDMQSFVASTFDLYNEPFREENLCFEGSGKDLLCYGGITAKGHVYLLGDRVGLFDQATITVPSGRVLIGGDYQGKNNRIPNASMVYLGPDASVSVSALEEGNGGTIVLWGNVSNQAYGALSARGGRRGGDGGLIEVSSPKGLDFSAAVETLAPYGKTGMLLLDPLDLTISGLATTNVTAPPPVAFLNSMPNGAGANLQNTALQTALASNNVTVQTTGSVGGQSGDITVSAPISWSPVAGTQLILRSANSIFVNSSILESSLSNTGGVILIAPNAITITSLVTNAAVGSLNGITMVGDPALPRCSRSRPNLTLQAGGVFVSQLGFYNPATVAGGLIDVTCGTLDLIGGIGTRSSAQIGHGIQNSAAGIALSTAATATITVDAIGDITLQPVGLGSTAIIGHSNFALLAGSSIFGDICVSSGGRLSLVSAFGSTGLRAHIGHGSTLGTFLNANGRVDVQVAQDIVGIVEISNALSIGHYTQLNAGVASVIGDVNIFCGNDLTINQSANPSAFYLGHAILFLGAIPTLTSDLTLSIGRDLNITQNTPGTTPCVIGSNAVNLTGNVQIAVGRDFTFSSVTTAVNTNFQIGYFGNPFSPGLTPNNTYIAVGRNLFMNSTSGYSYNVFAPNDLNIGVGGDIDFMISGTIGGTITSRNNPAGGTTRIYAAGHLLAQSTSIDIGLSGGFLDLRSGTDMQLFNGFNATGGDIFLGVGMEFSAGELWTNGMDQLASVCLQPLPIIDPIPCSSCSTIPFSLNTPSIAVAPQCGSFNPALFPQLYSTTTGSITIASVCNQCTTDPLSIGVGGNVQIATTSGDIAISSYYNIDVNQTVTSTTGSVDISACNNLNINQPVITASGPINLTADSDLSGVGNLNILANITTLGAQIHLNAGFPGILGATSAIDQSVGTIASSGGNIIAQAGGDILISGASTSMNADAGNITIQSQYGNVQIDENILSTSGNVEVIADLGDVLLTMNTGTGGSIQTGSGSINLTAGNDINIDGDPSTLNSSSGGMISTLAGDNTFVSREITTGGSIQMISGNNMFMAGAANITSTASNITLVVDADFPQAPLIGTGFFSMAAGTELNAPAGALRIFTAQQPLNSILGFINGFSFTEGVLFEDTNTEIWCTYFPSGASGFPFTVFYKNCLQQATEQAMLSNQQLLFIFNEINNLNWPYYGVDEYYGWPTKFFIKFHEIENYENILAEPYFQKRKNRLLLAPSRDPFRAQ